MLRLLVFASFGIPLACGGLGTPPPVQSRPADIALEIFLIHEAPAPHLSERRVEATQEIVFLTSAPDFTAADMAWAQLETDAATAKPKVLVHLTPAGMDRLASLTRENIGKRLAIVFDGRIIATPLIQREIRDGRLTLMGFQSAADAQRAAAALAR